MKFLRRILGELRTRALKNRLVVDPKQLMSESGRQRLVIFGSRCVVIDHKVL